MITKSGCCTTGIQILDALSPGCSALPSPVADRESTFCPSGRTPMAASAEMAMQPCLDGGAVQDETHHVFADGSLEQ